MAGRQGIEDAALLEAWSRGDLAAGTALFERHYLSIARFFHNKVNEAAYQDLIHETFLACQKSAARFRGQASFRSYLFGIAHNVLAGHLRQLTRHRQRLAPDMDLEELPAVSFGLLPIAAMEQREEQRLLLEALRRIPLHHQLALELHYWEALTAAEVGEVLGIPLGTAKTRLRKGRVYLEAQLRKLAHSPETLQSTLDNLEGWAQRIRAQIVPKPGAGGVVPDLDGDAARGR